MQHRPRQYPNPKPRHEANFNAVETNEFEELESLLTEEIAIRYLEKVRWGEKVTCIYCGSDRIRSNGFYQQDNISRRYGCTSCGKKFLYLTDTMFSGNLLAADQQLLILMLLGQGLTVSRVGDILNLMHSHIRIFETKMKIALNNPEQEAFIKKVVDGIKSGELLKFVKNYKLLEPIITKIQTIEETKMGRPQKEERDTLISANEAAKIIGVSKFTIAYWRKKEMHMPFTNKDGKVKYNLADVKRVKKARDAKEKMKSTPTIREPGQYVETGRAAAVKSIDDLKVSPQTKEKLRAFEEVVQATIEMKSLRDINMAQIALIKEAKERYSSYFQIACMALIGAIVGLTIVLHMQIADLQDRVERLEERVERLESM